MKRKTQAHHRKTYTFQPSKKNEEELDRLTKPFSRGGKVARGITTFYINDALEAAFSNPNYKPNGKP